MELPCTPLERGVKNYYPEGVKGKKTQSPTFQTQNSETSFSTSTFLSPKLNYFSNNKPKATEPVAKNNRLCLENQTDLLSSLNLIDEQEFTDKQQEIYFKSFSYSNQIEKELNNDTLKFEHSREIAVKSISHTSMRCESVEPFFPDIFSTSFCLRPTSDKNVNTNVMQSDGIVEKDESSHEIDNVMSLPSCSSMDPMTSLSGAVEDPVFSSEESMLSVENNETDEGARDFGFKVHVRIKPLDDQDVGKLSL